MKAKYSPDFAEAYQKLSPELQQRFQEIDLLVQADDLSGLDKQGWAYFADIDKEHVAVGSHRVRENVFYWMFICSPQSKPMIL